MPSACRRSGRAWTASKASGSSMRRQTSSLMSKKRRQLMRSPALRHQASRQCWLSRPPSTARQAMGEVAEGIAVALELARGQDLVERAAEDRQQDLVVGLPVDVEEAGEAAGAAVAQHVGPPGVGRIGRHVIGHDVEDQPQARRGERRRQGAQAFLAAQLGIDARGVDHVVAVLRARPRRGDGRGVEVADAEPREVRHQGLGIGEGEAAMELQAQRGARGHRRWRRMISTRWRTAGASNSSRAGGSRRRRQLGCSSIVPGRLGCSASPNRSSSGASISGEGDCAT